MLGGTRGKGAPRVTPRAKLNPPVMSKFDLMACLARLEEKGAPRVTPRAKLNPPVMSKFDLMTCLARLEEKKLKRPV